jgi:hypothetical protein
LAPSESGVFYLFYLCFQHTEGLPGGGVDKLRRQWKKKKGKYLFNKKAMAKVFRARFLAALNKAGLSIPKRVPAEWVADCSHVGKGITALKYLSRYLYRGVISEKNIVSNQNGQVTFNCTSSYNMCCQKDFGESGTMGFFMVTQKSCCLWCN